MWMTVLRMIGSQFQSMALMTCGGEKQVREAAIIVNVSYLWMASSMQLDAHFEDLQVMPA